MRKTIQEILFQPRAWENTIKAFSKRKKEIIDFINRYPTANLMMTGCGTSYYLPLTGSALYTRFTGREASGVPASEIMLCPETLFAKDRDYLLVSISRSGKTPETLAAARYVKDVVKGGTMLITCSEGSELGKVADFSIVCPEAAEETKYMTKSFTSMLLGFQLITAYVSGNEAYEKELLQLPALGDSLIRKYQSSLEHLAGAVDANLYIYLGHGPLYGIAAESMLKIKEMACVPSEAFHGMEFWHGPKYAVNEKTMITCLLTESMREQEMDILKKIKSLGARVKVICEESNPEIDQMADDVFELRSGLAENSTPIPMMLLTQFFGYYRALALGCDLD